MVEEDHAPGLQAEIFLVIGCRVVLCTNLWVEEELLNGALGAMKYIVYGKRLWLPYSLQVTIV